MVLLKRIFVHETLDRFIMTLKVANIIIFKQLSFCKHDEKSLVHDFFDQNKRKCYLGIKIYFDSFTDPKFLNFW